jgi:polygalacturonase
VKDVGARCDGATDDTASIQNAIDQIAATGGTVLIPAGTCMVNAVTRLNLKSHMTFKMNSATVLQAITNDQTHYDILRAANVTGLTISGGTLIGDRTTHIGTTGEWGYGIGIYDSSNITVQNVTSKNMWGDGILVGTAFTGPGSSNITITGVTADNNRRQGMSIVEVNGINVSNSQFSNTNGTIPQCGIDIEPDATENINNVNITTSLFFGNALGGICGNLISGTTATNITINNNIIDELVGGFGLQKYSYSANSLIWRVTNNKITAFYGFDLENSTGNTITGNTICANAPLYLDAGGNTESGNTLTTMDRFSCPALH